MNKIIKSTLLIFLISSSAANTSPLLSTYVQSTCTLANHILCCSLKPSHFWSTTSLYMAAVQYVYVPSASENLTYTSCLYSYTMYFMKTSWIWQFGIHFSLLWAFIECLIYLFCVLLCMHIFFYWNHNLLRSNHLLITLPCFNSFLE